MVGWRQSFTSSPGVISGGVTIEGNTIYQHQVRKINRRLKREMKEVRKDMMKEVKRQSKTL